MRLLVPSLLVLAACQSNTPSEANTSLKAAVVPDNAVSVQHGVENRVDGCTMSTFYIMNVEGTPTARATWHCDGQPPQDPRELVQGDCVMFSTKRWCVHDVVLVHEDSNEPGSSQDKLILVPQ